MVLMVSLLVAMTHPLPTSSQPKITSARAQVGCATIKQYESYHTSTYEKDGATPRTEGCVLLNAGTALKDLGNHAEATIMFGDKVPIDEYEANVNGKTLILWLSPSSVEKPKAKKQELRSQFVETIKFSIPIGSN